jgi:hypothetical protein
MSPFDAGSAARVAAIASAWKSSRSSASSNGRNDASRSGVSVPSSLGGPSS